MAINLKEHPIILLMEEIEETSEGMLQNIISENTDYDSFYARQESIIKKSNEIMERPMGERINYYTYLDHKMWFSEQIEDFEEAAKLKNAMERFRLSYLYELSRERLEPYCHSR